MNAKPGPKPAEAKPRARMIEAGYRLCPATSLTAVTPLLIAGEAGVPLSEFEAQFGDLRGYFLALQLHFLDELRARIVNAAMNTAPGRERLHAATCAFLDGCLAQRTLRVWLLELRDGDVEVQEDVAGRYKVYCDLLRIEFDSLGAKHADEAARLFFAMTQETSRAEHLAGRALQDMRETMFGFLGTCNANG